MLDSVEAYKILGVSKGAGKNEIEKRYSILIKKHRASVSEGTADEREHAEFEELTRAYNYLMGYEEPKPEEPFKPNPLMKKMGIDEKKARNFFYYYKIHMLVGIIVLLVVGFSIRSCATAVHPDFNTAFIGEINFTDTDTLKTLIQAAVPDIKEPGFDGAFLTADGNSEQDVAMQQKAMVLFAAGDVDLFIMDKANFQRCAGQGAFMSLDDIAGKIGVNMDANKDYVLKTQDDSTAHLYGIDISNSAALKKAGIGGKEFIAAIAVNSKKHDTAVKLLEFLMK